MTEPTVEEIARGLTKAQRALMLRCMTATAVMPYGPECVTARSLKRKGCLSVGRGWQHSLTDLGRAVAAAIREQEGER